jgi:hypothetical protein
MLSSSALRAARNNLVLALANILFFSTAVGQASNPKPSGAGGSNPKAAHSSSPAEREGSQRTKRSLLYTQIVWGVNSISAQSVESGAMIRFTYRVMDPQKAKPLSDKRLEPYMVDERAHVKLVVPSMEKVGQLRQAAPPEEGRSYWMLFSNKGGYVKRGDRVSVVIGTFHVDQLVVQ